MDELDLFIQEIAKEAKRRIALGTDPCDGLSVDHPNRKVEAILHRGCGCHPKFQFPKEV